MKKIILVSGRILLRASLAVLAYSWAVLLLSVLMGQSPYGE